jgi:hypothetical protein
MLVVTSVGMDYAYATEKQVKLFKQGYQLITTGNVTFNGCESNKLYRINNFIFECAEYHYSYHYGDADIMARKYTVQGHDFVSAYLCVDGDENECMQGNVIVR